jgi:hypothetical protein
MKEAFAIVLIIAAVAAIIWTAIPFACMYIGGKPWVAWYLGADPDKPLYGMDFAMFAYMVFFQAPIALVLTVAAVAVARMVWQ